VSKGLAPLILHLGIVRWSTSLPDRFTPGKNPGTSLVGGRVVPREGLDFWIKDVFLSLPKVLFPDLPAGSLVTKLNELPRFPFSDEYEPRILSSRPTVIARCTG